MKAVNLPEYNLNEVTGGNDDPHVKTVMKCSDCYYMNIWRGNYLNRHVPCPQCGSLKFKGVELKEN